MRKLLVRVVKAVVLLFARVVALDKLGFQVAPLVAAIGDPWVCAADYGAAEGELYGALVERFRQIGVGPGLPQREVRIIDGGVAAARSRSDGPGNPCRSRRHSASRSARPSGVCRLPEGEGSVSS